MHIGILQTGHLPDDLQAEVGDYDAVYARFLAQEGLATTAWPVVDGIFPDGIEAADGWIITGSRHGAYEDHPWIPPLEDFIREIYASGKPLVGICFGHQIIAQALGGKVDQFHDGWAVGPHDYDWNGDTVTLNAWHKDQVIEKPAEAEVVASSPFCQYAALTYGKRAFTVQAHPEFDRTIIENLMTTRAPGVVAEDRLAQARERLGDPRDDRRLAHQIAEFFKEASHG
jgi:GMP synthase (glutamine-hydrolysing)